NRKTERYPSPLPAPPCYHGHDSMRWRGWRATRPAGSARRSAPNRRRVEANGRPWHTVADTTPTPRCLRRSLPARRRRPPAARPAAPAAGASARTVPGRLAEPAFRQQVSQARAALITQAAGQLAEATGAAIGTLRELLASPMDFARLGAARAILELATKLLE